jgi:hypothetical protein
MSGNDRRIEELREAMEKTTREMATQGAIRNAEAQYQRATAQKMVEAQDAAMQAACAPMPLISPKYDDHMRVAGTGVYFDNTTEPEEWRRAHGGEITNKTTNHGNGFFSDIRICQDDYIRFKLFRGGWFCKLLYMTGWREPRGEDGNVTEWKNIANQHNTNQNLEVNLGKTYLYIDELIAGELEAEEHEQFIRDMAKTDPENLKMIAGLKNLDDGMKAPLDAPLNGVSAQKIPKPKTIPPSITLAKQAAMSSNWSANMGSALAANGEEIIHVDPKGEISFGTKMASAIKAVHDEPETELLKTGKAP